MSVILESEVRFSNLSMVDEVGRVFHWDGRICRGIYPGAAEQVRELFASGCLEDLMQRKLFPKSQITDHTFENFAFVVEHEAIPFVTYPHEWSFDMFRDAALAILDVEEIAGRYGWGLKDCHPYNILFDGVRPMFVDLGSFTRASPDAVDWGHQFLNLCFRPLLIWAMGDLFLAKRIISSGHDVMPSLSWRFYGSRILRATGTRLGPWIVKQYDRVSRRVARVFHAHLNSNGTGSLIANRLPADLVAGHPGILRRKITKLKMPAVTSTWGSYHQEYLGDGKLNSTPRFDRIVDIIRTLDCKSSVELAANQGLLSLLLTMRSQVEKLVCIDYDANAINRLYNYLGKHFQLPTGKTLELAVVDFMIPETNFFTEPPDKRFRSDVVLALAVTHHLTLSQGFQLREIMRTIAGYTRRFALVEFMPLGLWNGQEAPPLPNWYNLDWFQRSFCEFFDILQVEELETNRVLHVGRSKRSPAS